MNEYTRREKIQVLVVEDSSEDTRLLQEACNHCASLFHYVKNGEEALDYLHGRGSFVGARRPDLIIFDLQMSGANSAAALSEIKDDPGLRLIPVIALSTSSSNEEIRKIYNGNVACVVKKPSELAQFIEVCQAIGRFWLDFVCYPARAE
jgi:CheY-like chemotaxis protein